MTTTSQLRNLWAPPCTGPFSTVPLHGQGKVTVDAAIVPAVNALNVQLKAHAYPTRKADTGGYNCRKITGGTGYSLHAYGIAIDLNWQSNPYGPALITDMPPAMVADIKAIRTNNGKQVWRWGGDYTNNKDAMHFEIICSPADIATGIRSGSPSRPEEPDMTPEESKKLTEIHAYCKEAVALCKQAVAEINEVSERQVPEATVREDIVLNREIAKKVGVE